MDPVETRHRVRRLIEPTVRRLGFDLVAVEWTGDGKGPILRLSIDSLHGVSISDCATVSQYVSPLLDEDDPVSVAYRLEVSSPGIERPVERLEDFEQLAGYKAKIRLFDGHPRRNWSGRLAGVSGTDVLLRIGETDNRISIDAIERAHLVLDLDEYADLGVRLYGEPSATEAPSGEGPEPPADGEPS